MQKAEPSALDNPHNVDRAILMLMTAVNSVLGTYISISVSPGSRRLINWVVPAELLAYPQELLHRIGLDVGLLIDLL